MLTLTDFLEVVGEERSWQREYLHNALGRGALIIAGTSYRDPDVRQWLHAAGKQAPEGHAALVLLARQGFSVTREQFKAMETALTQQWRGVGLRPVLLHDHSDAAQVIRELRFVNDEDYAAPQQRALQVWRFHQERFEDLQNTYVAILRADSERMRSALDVEDLNITLWIADGAGRLVRWAAEDRVHLNREGLRAVEVGHDSPWIAGQALGTDAVLIKDVEESGTRKWRSVLAGPVPVLHPDLPPMSSAVITIGLPDEATQYESSSMLWVDEFVGVIDDWSSRISEALVSGRAQ